MANLVDAILSGKRFRKRSCSFNEGEPGVWLYVTKDATGNAWIAYDECHTYMKKWDGVDLGNSLDDLWEVDGDKSNCK